MSDITTTLKRAHLRIGRAIHRHSWLYDNERFDVDSCPSCGETSALKYSGVLWPELVLQWRLSPGWANWMDQREGLRCRNCNANLRSRQLAQVIVGEFNTRLGIDTSSLSELCQSNEIQGLAVAEINAAGDNHQFLANIGDLKYSEYGSVEKRTPSEDLLNLSYQDNSFDLIVNSDVLEHVPDVCTALSEIRRTLKPGGLYIFTVPIIWAKPDSRQRARMVHGSITHTHPPSYHGERLGEKNDFLVFYEFGRDFIETCKKAGFHTTHKIDPRNPSLITLTCEKPG